MMCLETQHQLNSLYEKDFTLWVEETVALLKNQNFQELDLANLIEEVESLGKSQKQEIKNRLITLLELALKRKYVNSPHNYRGWVETIVRTQDELRICLEVSPNLLRYWQEIFDECYQLAKRRLVMNTDYQNYKLPENNLRVSSK